VLQTAINSIALPPTGMQQDIPLSCLCGILLSVLGFKGSGFKVQPSRRPKKRPVKSKKKLMNIERPTSNVE